VRCNYNSRVLDVDRITDFDQLKQVTRLLHKENERLHERLVELTRELASLRGEQAQSRLALEIGKLQSQMEALQRRLGKVSERRGSKDPGGPDESEPARRGHGPRSQPKLPIEIQVHKLEPEQQTCPACDGSLEEWPDQFDETEEVTVVQREFKLVVHRCQKYRCRCNGAVVTASKPEGRLVQRGGRYSLEFAVEVAVDKYLNHLPLDRQRRMSASKGS